MAQFSPEKLRDVCRAAGTGDIETVNAWLNTEPDIHAQDDYGWSLIYAVVRGGGGAAINAPKVDLVRRLLALGADANAKYHRNELTLLHIA